MSDLAGKRIGLLTASASRLGGGVAEVVVAQAALLRDLGAEPLVFALHDSASAEDRARFGPTPVSYAEVRGPARFGYAPGLVPMLERAELDLLHLHGIWMYPSRAATVWRRLTGRPFVISPHGMLADWITARGRPQKAAARLLYERASWRAADALHALTGAEAREIARESGREDAAVIPNAAPAPVAAAGEMPPPHVLYLGRIHPKKNLAALLDGWRRASLPTDAALTVAGWGAAEDIAWLERVIADIRQARFVGPLHGAQKEEALQSHRFMALPSFSEGLPMAVLESWAAGVPVLMSAQCNLPEGFAAGAALECGTAAGMIAQTLTRALSLDAAGWRGMADAALQLAAGPFSAATVARRWAALYGGLMERAR